MICNSALCQVKVQLMQILFYEDRRRILILQNKLYMCSVDL